MTRRRQLTICQQILIGFSIFIVLLLGLGYSARTGVNMVGRQLDFAVNSTARGMDLVGELRTGFRNLQAYATRNQFAYVMTNLVKGNSKTQSKDNAAQECALCHSQADRATAEREFGALAAEVSGAISKMRALAAGEADRNALDKVEAGIRDYVSMFGEYEGLASQNRFDDAHAILRDRMVPLVEGIDKTLDKLHQDGRAALDLSNQRAVQTISHSQWMGLSVIAISLLVTGGIMLVMRKNMCRLRGMAADLSQGAEQVASAASQLSSVSQSLAQGASEQAAAIEETSASTEEINAVARRNTDNSRGAADLVSASHQKYVDTNQALDQMVIAMADIKSSSDKISKIIKTIDEIAFQTNILALNAAVEAARAGQAGLGFAVVADEVRNLAQRSAQAARETAALIEESIAKSNDGKIKVDQVAAAIHAITDEAGKVKMLVDEVNLGSQEQTRGLDQIGRAMSQMDQVTQKTAANAEESAAAAEELSAQSATLKEVVRRLGAMVGIGAGSGVERTSLAGRQTPPLSPCVTRGQKAIPLDGDF